jgi:Na+(H+)/acetate symporter ActP
VIAIPGRRLRSRDPIAKILVDNSLIVFLAETLGLLGALAFGWVFSVTLVDLVATVAAFSLVAALLVARFAPPRK